MAGHVQYSSLRKLSKSLTQATLEFIYFNVTHDIFRVIKSRKMRLARYVARTGARRGVYRVLVGKYEGKRSLGRTRRRWEDNIKIDCQEVGCGVWTESMWFRIGTGGGHL